MSAEIRRRTMSELQAITFNTNGVECIVTIDISGLTRDGQPVSSLPVTISSNAPPPNFVVSIDGKTTTPEPVEQLEQLDYTVIVAYPDDNRSLSHHTEYVSIMDASSPTLKEDCIKIAIENLADNGDIDPEEATEGTYTFVVLPGHVEEL